MMKKSSSNMSRSWFLWGAVVLGCFCGLVVGKSDTGPQGTGQHASAYNSNNDVNNVSPKSTSNHRTNHNNNNKLTSKSYVTINTKQGKITGAVQNIGGVRHTRFLGVPYALPPTGENRFRPPERHPGWSITNAYDGTQYKSACLQATHSMKREFGSDFRDSDYLRNIKTDENCLYLNIYIPKNLSSVEHINTLSLPVMIFVHGWDFENEVPSMHEGWRLATHGNVIVASVSYRVGVFGFLSVAADAAQGNYGLLDQRLAMHWIWDNIREFGGNPEKITIFGASSGAASVGFHMVSPLSRGLFKRAISQSGNALSPDAIQRYPRQAAFLLAESLQCTTSDLSDMLTCLRSISPEQLLKASISIIGTTQGWLPVVDGHFLPEEPVKLLEQAKFNPVDYLVGYNNYDGYIIQSDLPYDLSEGIGQDQYEDLLGHFTRKYVTGNTEHIEKAVLMEYAFCGTNATQRGRNIVNFLTDLLYAGPTELMSRLLTRGDERRAYVYEFSHRPQEGTEDRPDFVKSSHGDELPFVFGEVNTGKDLEVRLSNALMSAWTNFAKTGNPNPVVPGLFWEPYTVGTRKYVEFSTVLSGKSSKSHLRARQMAFWNDYIYNLRKSPPCSATRDVCERSTRPVKLHEAKVSTVMWALSGVCFVLMCIIVLLCVRIWMPPEVWKKCTASIRCCKDEKEKAQELERKKLHPLPYYDEPT